MSRKGENIYKRKDGRWEARYIKAYTIDGKARYGYCYAASYHEVKEKVSLKKTARLLKKSFAAGTVQKQFEDCCEGWLRLNKMRIKESTYVKYYSMIHKHIIPGLGGCSLNSLSSVKIEAFKQMLTDEAHLSPKSVKDIMVLLKTILKYTQKTCFGMNEDIEIIYPKEAKKEMRVLTREEEERFIAFLMEDMDRIRFGILLTLMTGLRIGEICALRWSNIYMEEKVIRVGATMQRIKKLDPVPDDIHAEKTKIIISTPKSDSSVRVIPLTDHMAELCRMMYEPDPEAYVLSGSRSEYVEPRILQYKLKCYTKECHLEGVHFHTLRHSFATRCVEVGFEIKSLSEILGHSNPRITLERYVHSSIELKRSNMNKLMKIGF